MAFIECAFRVLGQGIRQKSVREAAADEPCETHFFQTNCILAMKIRVYDRKDKICR